MNVGEATYIVHPLGSESPCTVLAGPSQSDLHALEQLFIREREGGGYILENARFNTDSFFVFIDWLKTVQGFRDLPWVEWEV